jgi:hypothetical protein
VSFLAAVLTEIYLCDVCSCLKKYGDATAAASYVEVSAAEKAVQEMHGKVVDGLTHKVGAHRGLLVVPPPVVCTQQLVTDSWARQAGATQAPRGEIMGSITIKNWLRFPDVSTVWRSHHLCPRP